MGRSSCAYAARERFHVMLGFIGSFFFRTQARAGVFGSMIAAIT